MMNAAVGLTILGSVLASLVSALTIIVYVKGSLRRTVAKAFELDVFHALNENVEKYKAFHERVFAPELDRGRRAADKIDGVQHDLTRHMEDFTRFRAQYEGHQELLILVPKSVAHVERAVDRLNETMVGVGAALTEVREDVAFLKGQAEK